jgi:hypothetical protein
MAQITYANKVKLNDDPSIQAINKVRDVDMNEIKEVVNQNDNDFQNTLPTILYSDSTGTTGTVTLSDDSSNYEYLDVYGYETTTNSSIYTKYDVASGKYLNLNTNVSSENGNLMRYISTNYSVSGTSIIPSTNSGIVNIFDKTINAQQQENAILITKVVGWR